MYIKGKMGRINEKKPVKLISGFIYNDENNFQNILENMREIYGKTDFRQISPFVADIENKLLKNETGPPIKKKKGPVQMTLF